MGRFAIGVAFGTTIAVSMIRVMRPSRAGPRIATDSPNYPAWPVVSSRLQFACRRSDRGMIAIVGVGWDWVDA